MKLPRAMIASVLEADSERKLQFLPRQCGVRSMGKGVTISDEKTENVTPRSEYALVHVKTNSKN